MPDDLNAMREVAGDEELVLEEETLDAGNYLRSLGAED